MYLEFQGVVIMDREKILSKNKEDNMFIDEYEKHIKSKGNSFGLAFTLLVCIVVYLIKHFSNEDCTDILTVIWAVAAGSMGYEAYLTKDRVKIILTVFFLFFMLYYFVRFIITVLRYG